MKRFIRRPSPALVIACLALFISLGGVSYGLATGVISGREIKNRTITGKDIRDRSLRGNKAGADSFGAEAIKESTLGTVPFAAGVENAAVVNEAGALVRGRGTAASTRTGVGRYAVIFNRDVRGCFYVASVGDEGAAGPGGGVATVAGLNTNANAVAVRTSNNQSSEPQNRSFHLIVTC